MQTHERLLTFEHVSTHESPDQPGTRVSQPLCRHDLLSVVAAESVDPMDDDPRVADGVDSEQPSGKMLLNIMSVQAEEHLDRLTSSALSSLGAADELLQPAVRDWALAGDVLLLDRPPNRNAISLSPALDLAQLEVGRPVRIPVPVTLSGDSEVRIHGRHPNILSIHTGSPARRLSHRAHRARLRSD